ncbi:nephrocystin-3 [Aspergillus awamori]|uniref:Nephrocystin-3 n=1 Tax=Aspergillus awamori TaxID=105351 RepID=A0A401KDS1_ASPAW|nr:nephrocystin-3 [Aspergillus awamori]
MENEQAHQKTTQSKTESHDQTCPDVSRWYTAPVNDDSCGGESGSHEATIEDQGSLRLLDLSTLESIYARGVYCQQQGAVTEAKEMLLRASKAYEEIFGLHDNKTLDALEYLGTTYRQTGKLQEAESTYNRVLEGRTALSGPDHPTTLVAMNRLGGVYKCQGRLNEAEEIARKVWKVFDKTEGPEHISTIRAFVSLGNIALRRNDITKAANIYAAALDHCKVALGPDHSSTQTVSSNLALVRIRQERYPEAETMLIELVQQVEVCYGPKSVRVLAPRVNLANVYTRQKKYAEAQETLYTLLEIYKETYGEDHTKTVNIMQQLAWNMEKQGNLADAGEMLQNALVLAVGARGNQDQVSIDIMIALANVLNQQGQYIGAQRIHHQLYEAYQAKFGENNYLAISSLIDEGDMLIYQTKYTEAEAIFKESTRRCEIVFGAEDERTIYSLVSQCYAAYGLGRTQDIESHICRLLKDLDEGSRFWSKRAAWLFFEMSKGYLARGAIKEAEPLAVKAAEISLKLLGRGDNETILLGLNLDRVRRQLWQQQKGLPVEDTVSLTRDETTDSMIRRLELSLMKSLMRPNPSLPRSLRLLGTLYNAKWSEDGAMLHLEMAIDKLELAILIGEKDDGDRPECLRALGKAYRARFLYQDTLEDLRKAIELAEAALELKVEPDESRAEYLEDLCQNLIDLHERASGLEHLDRAIEVGLEALSLTPLDHPKRGLYLGRRASELLIRYQEIANRDDLEKGIELITAALVLTPKTESQWSNFCSIHADLYRQRFKQDGNIKDLEKAVDHATVAVRDGPADSPLLLDSLARQLEYRYQALGNKEDLDKSIVAAERALEVCEPGSKYRADYLTTLGNILLERFDATGHQEDLNHAILHLENARDIPKTNAVAEARCLSGLATAFTLYYKRTDDHASLEAAIHNERLALETLPDWFEGKSEVMNNMALHLTDRFRWTKMADDIDEAAKYAEMVLTLRPPNHMYYAGSLNNISNIMEARFYESKNLNDLNSAIEKAEDTLSATQIDHTSRTGRLFNLGAKYDVRYGKSNDPQDLQLAAKSFIDGWRIINGPPFHRVMAGSQAAHRLMELGRLEEATTIAMEVVDLLPQVTSRSLGITDQQHVVRKFSGMAGNACSLLLSAGRLHEALEYLERGRTVILDQLMSSRMDFSDLESTYPEHAAKFRQLQDDINNTFDWAGAGISETNSLVQNRLASVSKFNECIDAIRLLPGHDRFLLGPTIETMKSGAKGGLIVIVIISSLRSDAIIISEEAIDSVELPGLSYSETAEWLEKDLEGRHKNRADRKMRNEQYSDLLHWLWVSGVKPILDHTEFQPSSSARLPRISWIGCGMASLLPFHAAGDRTPGSNEHTFSYAISSYSLSIKTMFQARAKSREGIPGVHPALLMVGMPTTDGHASLPGVEDEIQEIAEVVEPSFTVKSLLHPQPSLVMSDLASYDMIHFACHAVSDTKSPLNGHLLLQGDTSNRSSSKQCSPLTVETIVKMDLKRARIAYLSACSTAENKGKKLLDEAIHLASSFQVAGFAHVLGTMWPAADSISRDVAVGFYGNLASLLLKPGVDIDCAVAEAFHFAVNDVRTEWEDQPLYWAQFVHFGG